MRTLLFNGLSVSEIEDGLSSSWGTQKSFSPHNTLLAADIGLARSSPFCQTEHAAIDGRDDKLMANVIVSSLSIRSKSNGFSQDTCDRCWLKGNAASIPENYQGLSHAS
uniref:Uncharacterized protein n=1 Tax=Rhodosorus marinus TaxID=101924 RepID=A0A7S2ZVN9_9RHOD|mmetsp:Transcript_32715/g.128541  ORF Transcript_32715/g.128541 Transcript_32715/m.128541 type:complete len:109 (+) Transcript_32715:288-614(+)